MKTHLSKNQARRIWQFCHTIIIVINSSTIKTKMNKRTNQGLLHGREREGKTEKKENRNLKREEW